ncbi:MAG TPA: hypothetical protein VFO06_08965 [Gemmatimonadales bacterium]|nr:hypothetical protein [Gemmatimonadales bacterium]
MTHLRMDQLLALRDAGSEPGSAEAGSHIAECAACAAELERLHQRVARMRALPGLRPPRDRFAEVALLVRGERRQARLRRLGVGAMALAASMALIVIGRDVFTPDVARASDQLTATMAESAALEQALQALRPDQRVTDAYTARVAASLEDRIADLDRRLSAAQSGGTPAAEAELLGLWRERVGLMDALVDVHVTRAEQVGL